MLRLERPQSGRRIRKEVYRDALRRDLDRDGAGDDDRGA